MRVRLGHLLGCKHSRFTGKACFLLALSVGAVPRANAADDIPDCIATPLADGASMRVGLAVEVLPKAGKRFLHCNEIRFEQPSVRVRFITPGDIPFPDRYDSKVEDRGVLVAERIKQSRSFPWFFDWKSPSPTPVPAGRYAGVVSPVETPSGTIIVFMGRSRTYADNPHRLQGLVVNEVGTPLSASTRLVSAEPCSFDLKYIADCANPPLDRGERKVSYFYTKSTADFEADKGYFMMAKDNPSVAVAGVPTGFIRNYLKFVEPPLKDPVEANAAQLDVLLNDVAFAIATKDDNKLRRAKAQLATDFPHLFPTLVDVETGNRRQESKAGRPR